MSFFNKNTVDLFRSGFFKIPFRLLSLNLLIIISAYFSASYIPDTFGESEYWFQRSGALVTLITIWFEVKILDVISERKIFNEISDLKVTLSYHIPNFSVTILSEEGGRKATSNDMELSRKGTRKHSRFYNGIVFTNFVVGTFIWAYGDLIYINMI